MRAGMAEVASEGDNGLVVTTAVEGCRALPVTAETASEDATAATDNGIVDDKVSIHEILEGMTNEFNKGVSPAKHNDSDKVGTEETITPLSPSPSKVLDEGSKGEKECDDAEADEEVIANSEDDAIPQVTPEENHRDEDEGSVTTNKQETVKKDNGIPRIVLTFRTIDENTDHGKKTKISSCSSNLTLVPDELANCDQIGGVSVKIENSDENSDAMEESQTEESQAEESQTEETKKEESTEVVELKTTDEDKAEDAEEKQNSDTQLFVQKKPETVNNIDSNNVEAKLVEDTEQQETIAPITRKRRIGRPRLRALRFLFLSYLPFIKYLHAQYL